MVHHAAYPLPSAPKMRESKHSMKAKVRKHFGSVGLVGCCCCYTIADVLCCLCDGGGLSVSIAGHGAIVAERNSVIHLFIFFGMGIFMLSSFLFVMIASFVLVLFAPVSDFTLNSVPSSVVDNRDLFRNPGTAEIKFGLEQIEITHRISKTVYRELSIPLFSGSARYYLTMDTNISSSRTRLNSLYPDRLALLTSFNFCPCLAFSSSTASSSCSHLSSGFPVDSSSSSSLSICQFQYTPLAAKIDDFLMSSIFTSYKPFIVVSNASSSFSNNFVVGTREQQEEFRIARANIQFWRKVYYNMLRPMTCRARFETYEAKADQMNFTRAARIVVLCLFVVYVVAVASSVRSDFLAWLISLSITPPPAPLAPGGGGAVTTKHVGRAPKLSKTIQMLLFVLAFVACAVSDVESTVALQKKVRKNEPSDQCFDGVSSLSTPPMFPLNEYSFSVEFNTFSADAAAEQDADVRENEDAYSRGQQKQNTPPSLSSQQPMVVRAKSPSPSLTWTEEATTATKALKPTRTRTSALPPPVVGEKSKNVKFTASSGSNNNFIGAWCSPAPTSTVPIASSILTLITSSGWFAYALYYWLEFREITRQMISEKEAAKTEMISDPTPLLPLMVEGRIGSGEGARGEKKEDKKKTTREDLSVHRPPLLKGGGSGGSGDPPGGGKRVAPAGVLGLFAKSCAAAAVAETVIPLKRCQPVFNEFDDDETLVVNNNNNKQKNNKKKTNKIIVNEQKKRKGMNFDSDDDDDGNDDDDDLARVVVMPAQTPFGGVAFISLSTSSSSSDKSTKKTAGSLATIDPMTLL